MLYIPQEVAEILRLKVTTIWSMIRDGRIKAVKIGKGYRISEEEVERLKRGEWNGNSL